MLLEMRLVKQHKEEIAAVYDHDGHHDHKHGVGKLGQPIAVRTVAASNRVVRK